MLSASDSVTKNEVPNVVAPCLPARGCDGDRDPWSSAFLRADGSGENSTRQS